MPKIFSEEAKERRERNKLIRRIIKNPSDYLLQAEIVSSECLTIKIIKKK